VLKLTPSFKLVDINNLVSDIQYTAGETIYDIGHNSSAFYLVKDGVVLLDTTIEIDSYYKIPIKKLEWEVRKDVKRINY